MKRFICILALVTAPGIALGAVGTPTNTIPTKTKNISANQDPVHLLGMRFRQIMIQIQKAQKAKHLTGAQAQDLRAQVMVIRKQEMADMKQNGSRTLTDEQITKLSQQLGQIQQSLQTLKN